MTLIVDKLALPVCSIILKSQEENGIRHEDYQRYRKFCTNKLRSLRSSMKFKHATKKNKFEKRDLSSISMIYEKESESDQISIKDTARMYLEMILFESERAWAFAMESRLDYARNPSKRHFIVKKSKRCVFYADLLENLMRDNKQIFHWISLLEVKAYAYVRSSELFFELKNWRDALSSFLRAKSLLKKLESLNQSGSEPGYQFARYGELIDLIEPKIRYSIFSLKLDSQQLSTIINEISIEGVEESVSDMLGSSADVQAQTTEIDWIGFSVQIPDAKLGLLYENSRKILSEFALSSKALSEFDKLVDVFAELASKSKIELDEAKEQSSTFESDESNEKVDALRLINAYAFVHVYSYRLARNWALLCSMCTRYNQSQSTSSARLPELQNGLETSIHVSKPPKLSNFIHIANECSNTIHQLMSLEWLSLDPVFVSTVDQLLNWFQAFKLSIQSVQSHSALEPNRSLKLLQEAETKLLECQTLITDENTLDLMEIHQSLLHLSRDLMKFDAAYTVLKSFIKGQKFLSSIQDPNHEPSGPKSFRIKDFHSAIQPVPVPIKPILFDLALNHVIEDVPFDELESHVKASSGAAASVTGMVGNFLGGFLGGNSSK